MGRFFLKCQLKTMTVSVDKAVNVSALLVISDRVAARRSVLIVSVCLHTDLRHFVQVF